MNLGMRKASVRKNDEFYTLYEDIEREVAHYMEQFKDKVVYCNCDDIRYSAFWEYFHTNYEVLGLSKLIATHYDSRKVRTVMAEYTGGNDRDIKAYKKHYVKGNGDFRSAACRKILQSADIIATNPPFSLFREYIAILFEAEKQFLIIGNKNVINCKDFFKQWQKDKVSLGYESPNNFKVRDKEGEHIVRMYGLCKWYTNMRVYNDTPYLQMTEVYEGNVNKYPKYANFEAINVDKVSDIPKDYEGVMGVPVTFLSYYNAGQFELLGKSGDKDWCYNECTFFKPPKEEEKAEYSKLRGWRVQVPYMLDTGGTPKMLYSRLFIRKRS